MVARYQAEALNQYIVAQRPTSNRAPSQLERLRALLPTMGAHELKSGRSHIIAALPNGVASRLQKEFGADLIIERNADLSLG
jgi:hypothetical protein